jgi:hypothetical protein
MIQLSGIAEKLIIDTTLKARTESAMTLVHPTADLNPLEPVSGDKRVSLHWRPAQTNCSVMGSVTTK